MKLRDALIAVVGMAFWIWMLTYWIATMCDFGC